VEYISKIFESFGLNLDNINVGNFISIGVGILFKALINKIQKFFKEIEEIKNKMELLDLKIDGELSFGKTLPNHEIRICVLEKLIDRREMNIPVKYDRRNK
jgi:hypothetical protein